MKTERFRFANAAGCELDARLELPVESVKACALFAHCFTCSKDIVAASRIARALAERGIAVLRFDFTGLGSSQGDFGNTSFSSNVSDLVSAADAIRNRLGAPALLVGHSLGGAAVISAAQHIPEVKGVITIGAPSSTDHVQHLFAEALSEIEDRGEAPVILAGRRFTIRKSFLEDLRSHRIVEDAKQLGRALLILHSPIDDTVGIDHARQLYEAATHPKSFISLDRADHLLTRKADAVYVAELITAWARRYLPVHREGEGMEPASI